MRLYSFTTDGEFVAVHTANANLINPGNVHPSHLIARSSRYYISRHQGHQQCLTNRLWRLGHRLVKQSDYSPFFLSNHKSPPAVFNQDSPATRQQVLASDDQTIQQPQPV